MVAQLSRLVSNLVLTRLLAPEAFGLMAIVHVYLVGLAMFSDVGHVSGVIRHPRGSDPAVLNTAWTIQVIRGLVLATVAALIAGPVARFYQAPEIAGLLAVCGLTALAQGFGSTAVQLRARQLAIGGVIRLDLVVQAVSLVVTVGLAAVTRSVWALAAGAVFGATARAAMSHLALGGPRNRFQWDRAAAADLLRYGRWVLVATAMVYVLGSVDRLVLGRYMTLAELGVYSVAYMLSQAVLQLVQSVAAQVMLPVYARLGEESPAAFRAKLRRLRLAVLAATLPVVCGVILVGPWVVGLLWPAPYREAGWMLQVLAVGTVVPILDATVSQVVLARGDSFRHMVVTTIRAAVTVAAMAVGGWVGGVTGLIVGYAAGPLAGYPVMVALVYRPYRLWMPGLDLAAVGVVAAAGLVALALAGGS